MAASMSSHHQITSFLRTVPLLKSLSEDQLGRVARAMDLKTYNNGELIIREDEEGDAFYIVVQVSYFLLFAIQCSFLTEICLFSVRGKSSAPKHKTREQALRLFET